VAATVLHSVPEQEHESCLIQKRAARLLTGPIFVKQKEKGTTKLSL
jgi:hypothetical protein